MILHTTQSWHDHAGLNLTQAQTSQKCAHSQQDESRRAHGLSVSQNLARYQDLQSSLAEKVDNSLSLIDKLTKRASSLTKSSEVTKLSLAELEAALQSLDAPLQTCIWRMQQREERPLREMIHDDVEVKLTQERTTIESLQRKLAAAIKNTTNTLHLLECRLIALKDDIAQKKQALGIDGKCLTSAQKSYKVHYDTVAKTGIAANLPAVNSTSAWHNTAIIESSANETSRHHDCHRRDNAACEQEQVAKSACNENTSLIKQCHRIVKGAADETHRATERRISENQQMMDRLKAEMKETGRQINNTKAVLSDTRHQIGALKEPMNVSDTCQSWRQGERALLERIQDPVSTKLHEQQVTVRNAHEDLSRTHDHEKLVLEELRARRERLKVDLRDKLAAYQIDKSCLRKDAARKTLNSAKTHRVPRNNNDCVLPMSAR